MRKYEGLFIFSPEDKEYSAEVTKWIEKFQGKVLQKTDMGKKNIGHPIKKFKEGKVLVFHFEMDPAQVQDFRKDLELQEILLKYMVTVFEEKKANVAAAVPQADPKV